MNLNLYYKKKKFSIGVKNCNGFRKISGLMFYSREKAPALLFEFNKPVKNSIHSFFVFFVFLVLWLDKKNNVIDYRIVKPFQANITPDKKFSKIVEIPLNKKYLDILNIIDERNI
ncbi:DUF192 domain-containing protein [Candidatus Pacearchaeota archaeon]|nr:DUF192 domain-containing protein [Candidatus Pacearchaeota archaeon]